MTDLLSMKKLRCNMALKFGSFNPDPLAWIKFQNSNFPNLQTQSFLNEPISISFYIPSHQLIDDDLDLTITFIIPWKKVFDKRSVF